MNVDNGQMRDMTLDDYQIGERIRTIRKRRGMTQEQLAEAANLSVPCITITNTYEAEEIPDPETPLDPGTNPTDPGTPVAPGTDIPEENPPKADAPETGDISVLWLALTGLSGSSLAAVSFLGRKKRDEE